jgi:hypothetical protein
LHLAKNFFYFFKKNFAECRVLDTQQ